MPSLSTTSSRLSQISAMCWMPSPVELHQKFFDLAAALLGLFVQRDADLAVGAVMALDVRPVYSPWMSK